MDETFQIIRGKRINDQLEESEELITERSSVNNLAQNTDGFQPASTKRQHATDTIRVVEMVYLPFIGTKNLNVDARVSSPNNKQDPSKQKTTQYSPKLIFNQVVFEEESTDANISFVAKDGQEYHMQPINLAEATVRVNCDCLDFYWRFKSYNAKDQSLAGRAPPPYKPISNRGPSNIKRVPGLCKHLLKTVEALKQAKMVT